MSKNRFGKFWNFSPWDVNFDLSQKMTEMISKWFFAIFRTLPFFLYGDQEPRSWGGVQTPPPPPPAGGGKSRGPAGRGLTRALLSFWISHHLLGWLSPLYLGSCAFQSKTENGVRKLVKNHSETTSVIFKLRSNLKCHQGSKGNFLIKIFDANVFVSKDRTTVLAI